ncbi:MAG: hypothetical protein HYR71_10950, partial [Chloroflexi bacterium]|nr:hypothetical protein [Chloroflexota bacterium]
MIGPYLFVSNDGSLESRGLVVYGALIAVAVLCSLWALRRKDWLWVVIPLVVPALSAMRVLGWPIVSARVFPFSMAALSVLGLVNYSLKPCYEFERWLTLLECRRDTSAAYDPRAELVVIAAHVVLLSVVLAQFPALSALPPPVWALVTIGVCLMPQIVMSIRRRLLGLSVGLLAPLALVYVVAGVRLFLTYTLGWALLPYAPGQPLDIGSALLTTENVALAVATYIVLMQLAQGSSNRQAWASGSARLLLGMSVIWAVWETIGSRTSGVTATDPYAYAQMAVDWVRRGTPVHEFPLFETITKLDIPYFAAVHQGYHLPINTALQNLRDAPSVWPAGASLFLAAGYWLFGEPGLYLVTPLFGLLSLALVWSLARRLPARYPTLLAALAVTLLATSYEQVDRLLVPMADVPAQFFSMLAIGIALYLPMTERSPDNLASATRR